MFTDSIFFIAEAGVNHNGDIGLAKELIDIASESGADAVKFQTFKASELCVEDAPLAKYQKKDKTSSQFDLLQRLELSMDDHFLLNEYATKANISFASTAFDIENLKFLINEIDIDFIKISSGDITNFPLLDCASKSSKPIILSSGASSIEDINLALKFIQHSPGLGLKDKSLNYLSSLGISKSNSIALLHCVTEYPAPIDDLNLKCITTLADEFPVPIGYSDHSIGMNACISAAALGVKVLEKHFTIDNKLDGPDHEASIMPDDLATLISNIREVERALGNEKKEIQKSEIENRSVIRRSIFAKDKIKKGEKFHENNITVKRPLQGICASRYFELINHEADRDYKKDEPIKYIIDK